MKKSGVNKPTDLQQSKEISKPPVLKDIECHFYHKKGHRMVDCFFFKAKQAKRNKEGVRKPTKTK